MQRNKYACLYSIPRTKYNNIPQLMRVVYCVNERRSFLVTVQRFELKTNDNCAVCGFFE